jgi:hypothetical protein
MMDLKQAVEVASSHLHDVFASEIVGAPRLEEFWFDEVDAA